MLQEVVRFSRTLLRQQDLATHQIQESASTGGSSVRLKILLAQANPCRTTKLSASYYMIRSDTKINSKIGTYPCNQ
eukprot:3349831-Amphidinium_carterae.1